jgi:hypothetical protein
MADLGEKLDQVEALKDTRMKAFGLRFTGTQLFATFALISSIASGGYGGLLLWQKVEALAELDLGAISSQMAKTSQDLERVGDDISAIKVELKKDMNDLRSSQYSLESRMDNKISSQDSKMTAFDQRMDLKLTSYDDKLFKFDQKLEKTKEDLNKRIQQSLDNPLAY